MASGSPNTALWYRACPWGVVDRATQSARGQVRGMRLAAEKRLWTGLSVDNRLADRMTGGVRGALAEPMRGRSRRQNGARALQGECALGRRRCGVRGERPLAGESGKLCRGQVRLDVERRGVLMGWGEGEGKRGSSSWARRKASGRQGSCSASRMMIGGRKRRPSGSRSTCTPSAAATATGNSASRRAWTGRRIRWRST